MYGVKNLSKRLRKHEIDFSQANAIFPERPKGLEDFTEKKRKPRKEREKKIGGTRFKFGEPSSDGQPSIRHRKFGTESFVERRYAEELLRRSGDVT